MARALDRDFGFSVVNFAASADLAVAEVGNRTHDAAIVVHCQ